MATVLQAEGVPAGIGEAQLSFDVYPNPSNGLITVKSNSMVIDRVKILDVSGRLVHEEETMPPKTLHEASKFRYVFIED